MPYFYAINYTTPVRQQHTLLVVNLENVGMCTHACCSRCPFHVFCCVPSGFGPAERASQSSPSHSPTTRRRGASRSPRVNRRAEGFAGSADGYYGGGDGNADGYYGGGGGVGALDMVLNTEVAQEPDQEHHWVCTILTGEEADNATRVRVAASRASPYRTVHHPYRTVHHPYTTMHPRTEPCTTRTELSGAATPAAPATCATPTTPATRVSHQRDHAACLTSPSLAAPVRRPVLC